MYRTLSHGGPWRLPLIIAAFLGSILVLSWIFSSDAPSPRAKHASTALSNAQTNTGSDVSTAAAAQPRIQEKEIYLPGGIRYFTREHELSHANILWLVMTKDASSWGKKNKEHRTRNFDSFLNLLVKTELKLPEVSLGLLTSDEAEYRIYKSATAALALDRVTVILHPGYMGAHSFEQANRKDPAIQAARRGEMAKLRNYLMGKSLRDEEHILWLDADVFELDQGIVQTMVRHANRRDDVGIITARCTYGENENYDRNAWAGTRPAPDHLLFANETSAQIEKDAPPRVLADELLLGTTDEDLIPLTAVGGTILYVRASLVLQGLNFPHQYSVGTRWMFDGYDGLETEGLCFRAKGLSGGAGCFLLGGKWHVRHMIN